MINACVLSMRKGVSRVRTNWPQAFNELYSIHQCATDHIFQNRCKLFPVKCVRDLIHFLLSIVQLPVQSTISVL